MKCRQHKIRGILDGLDGDVREHAKHCYKRMNTRRRDALSNGLGVSDEPALCHDMDDLVGTWVDDDVFDDVIASFR